MATRWMLILTLAVGLLAGCGGGGGGESPGGTQPEAQTATLRVQVRDVLGFARAGASVTLMGASGPGATTAADGTARLELPPDSEQVVAIELAGYTRQYRAVRVAAGATAFVEAAVMRRAGPLTLPDAAAGGTLVGRNAARLTLPPAALVDAVTGAAVTGAVSLEMTPLNTASHEAGAFPGGMRAVSGTRSGVLLTYGPVEYVFTQGGRRLQLASGKSALIEMPLHARLHPSGRALAVGEPMPVWSFDPARGLWVQEGEGTVVASASATGLALRASVGHFSWWNPDHFENPVELTVNFTVPEGTTLTACCQLAGVSLGSTGGTAPAGIATATLPQSGGKLALNGGVVYDFLGSAESTGGKLFGFASLAVPSGASSASLTVNLVPDTEAPNPVITSPEAGVTTYTRGELPVSVSVSGKPPVRVELRLSGQFVGNMLPNADGSEWTLVLDTTTRPQGTYELSAAAVREDPLLPKVISTGRTVVIDRTPPQVAQRTPTPGNSEVSPFSDVLAVFSEPVDPTSLATPEDSTETRVALLVGGPTGTVVPVAFVLEPDGVTLRLTPGGPLPTNTSYTVRLRNITDLAGNPLADTSWNFSVPVFARLSPDLRAVQADGTPIFVQGRPELAIDNAGRTLVVSASADLGQVGIQVRRQLLNGTWESLETLPVTAPVLELSMALNNLGLPVVAWTQNSPNTAGCTSTTLAPQLFVASLGAGGWQRLGDTDLNLGPCTRPTLPRVAVDGQGRPVLVSAQGSGGLSLSGNLPLRMPVLRFESGAWSQLGIVPLGAGPVPSNIVMLEMVLDGSVPLVLSSENRGGTIDHHVSRLGDGGMGFVGPRVAQGTGSQPRQALDIDPQGRPVVALGLDNTTLRVFRLEGSSWAALGGPATPTGLGDLGLVFNGLQPVISSRAFFDGAVRVNRLQLSGEWSSDILVASSAGRLGAMRRRADGVGGGPIRLVMTTGPSNRELIVFGADVLP